MEMEMLKAINELRIVNAQIQKLETLKDEDITELSKKIDSAINFKDGEIFTVDSGIMNFEEMVTSSLSKLQKFGNGVEYYVELDEKFGATKPADEIEKMALDRKAKIDELISKVERIGNINTVIRELNKRAKDFNIEERLGNKEKEIDDLIEIEENKIKAFAQFENDGIVKKCIAQLTALREKAKIEKENEEIGDQITAETAKRDSVSDTFKAHHQSIIDSLEAKITKNNEKINELDKKINGRTEDEIIDEIKSRVPDNLDKDAIEQAIREGDPKKGLSDVKKGISNQLNLYQNRKTKNSERREQISVGKEERTARGTRTPLTYNADDYSLTDEEKADIENLLRNNGEEIKAMREDIKSDMEAHPDKYPVPTGEDLHKQVREWLDKKEGKTRNPFKLLSRMRRVRSGNTQKQYIESLKTEKIDAEVRARLIDDKKREKFTTKKDEAESASSAKTATLDRIENAFKLGIRKAALRFDNDQLSRTVSEGNYGLRASEVLDTVLEDEAKKDDDAWIH